MNKGELVEAVAAELNQSKAAAGRAVDAFLESVASGLKGDGEVSLVGFGTFRAKSRPGRTGKHPRTGQPIAIRPGKTVTFRPGEPLKEKLNS